jgi:hypothetical protein
MTQDAITDEKYFTFWDFVKIIGIGSVLMVAAIYIILKVFGII